MNLGGMFYRKMPLVAIGVLMCLSMSFISCSSVGSVNSSKDANRVVFRSLGVEAFARVLEREDVLLLDVRTPEEYAAGHLVGVDYNLNVRSTTFFKDYQHLPKDKLIAMYCKGGGRSKQVAGVLAGNGYKVVELAVGYDGWVKSGREVEK